jgi:hypothetical protein
MAGAAAGRPRTGSAALACALPALFLLLAPPGRAAEPGPDAPLVSPPHTVVPKAKPLRLSGLWRRTRDDGVLECFEVFGERRFAYRDSAGAAASGDMRLYAGVCWLRSRDGRRAFRFELTPTALRLAPAPEDDPRGAGDLGRMSPVEARLAIWQRPGVSEAGDVLELAELADLAGTWSRRAAPGREERLTITADGACRYESPVAAVEGRCTLRADGLELTAGGVVRRLLVTLGLSPDGWALVLRRGPDDCPRPVGDLADMAPVLGDEARYERPLAAVGSIAGSYRCEGADDRVWHLDFTPDGTWRATLGDDPPLRGSYELQGVRLVLRRAESAERRTFRVQRLGVGLVTASDGDGAVGALRELPPGAEPYARWRAAQ